MALAPINGVEIYYEEHGQGTPIVFCHEFAGDYRSWAPQVRFFARRYRAITFSARGYHPSSIPANDEDYSEEQHVEDTYELIRFLGIEKAHVVGLSMGGNVTLKLGLAHPEVCLSLVVAGAGFGSTNPEEFRANSRETAGLLERVGMQEFAETYGRGPSRLRFEQKDPHGFLEMLAQLKEHSTVGSALTMRNVQGKRKTVYDVADQLPSLNVPTLVISGDEDELALDASLLMKRKIPNSGLLIVPKTGHTVNLEEPALFNQAVLDFVSAVDQGAWTARLDTTTGLLPPEK
ncbi:MAG TPA: alpha/beta hydrolase [Chloroflexota bacterium]|nr:alpha/beta hydrolase [Chloroflexota bacterium]